MEIKILPKSLRVQISAEYNITSVVVCITQLVMNSLDAKATSIAIRVNLTSNQIQVIDNGIGFSEENLKIVGVRYATSKYQTINDTERNQIVFPSRGIALHDIINLSKTVKILSRTSKSPRTFCKTFQNGNLVQKVSVVKQRPSKGTTITIYDFQYNKPVRNKCVNIDSLLNDIEKEIKYIAIRNPGTSFSLRNDANGSIIFQICRTNFVYKSILMIYGNIIKSSFKKIQCNHGNISVKGLINIEKYPQNIIQLIYLNRRYIKDSKLHTIIRFMLSKSKIEIKNRKDDKQNYYLYVINIDCPYTEFDVIDFNDLEVVFKDFDSLIKCMTTGLYNFLTQNDLLKEQNTNNLLNGSPIPEQDPSIRVSQVEGIVRGIPTKRKQQFSKLLDICENKIQKLDPSCSGKENIDKPRNNEDLGTKNILLDMFCKSLVVYGPDKIQNKAEMINTSLSTCLMQKNTISVNAGNINQITTSKFIQTSTVALSSKAIQTNTPENSDEFLFKKPLPPKPKLLKRKTELIHFQIKKSALDLFKPDENQNISSQKNVGNQRLQETCSKLKSRIYQEHLINQKYCSDIKKLQVKNMLYMRQNSSFMQPKKLQKIENTGPIYIPNKNKHQLSLFHPIFNKRTLCISSNQLNNLKPFRFNSSLENKVAIYNLKESNKLRKWYEMKSELDCCKNTKYIFTNNDNIVSKKTVRPSQLINKKNIYENNKFSGIQLPQLLPNIPKKNDCKLKSKNCSSLIKEKYKRLLSRYSLINNKNNKLKSRYSEFSFIPQNTNINCKTDKTFNSHLNLIKNKNQINKYNKQNLIPIKNTSLNAEEQMLNNFDNNSSIRKIDIISGEHNNLSKFNLDENKNYNNSNLQTQKYTLSNITNFSFQINNNVNKNLQKTDTPVTILEQNMDQINASKSKTSQLKCDQINIDNFYRQKNYKNIIHWLKNTKNIIEKLNNSITISDHLNTPNLNKNISPKDVELNNFELTKKNQYLDKSSNLVHQIDIDKTNNEIDGTPINNLVSNNLNCSNNSSKSEDISCNTPILHKNNSPKGVELTNKDQNLNNSSNSIKEIDKTANEINLSFMKSCGTPISNLVSNYLNCLNNSSKSEDISLKISDTINLKQPIEEIQINVNPFDLIETNNEPTEAFAKLNGNIQTLLKNLENNKDCLKMTPVKLKDPIYNSSISTVTPNNIINETSNSIHLIINNSVELKNNSKSSKSIQNNTTFNDKAINNERLEWIKQTRNGGTPYYLNKRTGMTSFQTPKSLEKYSMTTRQTYLPKGMSPILNTSNVQLNELTPNSRNILHQTMANTEIDEHQTIKWMNYLQNNDSKEFFANLYADKKHFEIELAKFNKQSLPKKLLTSFNNYSFTKDNLKDAIIINQYDKKFIVAIIKINCSSLLVIFDQHAVHERICLQKLIKDYQLEDGVLKSIKCNKSILLSLENNEIKMLRKYKKNFENWGLLYDIDDRKIKIKQIPLCWNSKDESHIKQDLIFRLIQEENTLLKKIGRINTSLPLIILNSIKTEACRSAIKFGDPLTLEQCSNIIGQLSECDLPFQCAHGRPSLVPILELNTNFEKEGQPNLNNLKINYNK